MSVNKFFEVEAKFSVSEDAAVPDLLRLPQVTGVGEPRVQELSAIYYDTEDLRLSREKITLRRRTGGEDDGWHLKLPATGGRVELHAPLGDAVDGQFTVPEELLAQVRSVVRAHPLAPVAQVDNHRAESAVTGDDGLVWAQLCDDRVTAHSLLPGGTSTTWREWEFELDERLSGEPEGTQLLQAATGLFIGAGARVSASPSKLVSALGDSAKNAPLPTHLRDPGVKEGSALAGVLEALRANRDTLIAYDPRVRRDEWDSVHQMRVATRELRSHLSTFSGVLRGEHVDRVQDELKLLAQILGQARDAEVVEERFLSLLEAEDSGTVDEQTRRHVREDMGAEYARAHRRVVAALNSDRYLQLLDDVDLLLAQPHTVAPAPAQPQKSSPERVLLEQLEKAYRKLLKRHREALDNRYNEKMALDDREENFHEVRKSAKKLRYAAEAVGAATTVKTKRLYKACKSLQSSLGEFQDAVTSRDKLLALARAAHRRGEDTFGYGLLYQREREVGRAALREYAEGIEEIRAAYGKITQRMRTKKK